MRFIGAISCLSVFFSFALLSESIAQDAKPAFSKQDILEGLRDAPHSRTHDLAPANTLPVATGVGTHKIHHNHPWIYRWFTELSHQKDLQKETEIQKALLNIVDHHPLRTVSHRAANYLPENHEKFQKDWSFFLREKPSDDLFCRPETLGASPLKTADDLQQKLVPQWSFTDESVDGVTQKTAPMQSDATPSHLRIKTTAQDVSGGWVVGYDRELGLHFVPTDDTKPTKKLFPGSYNYISPPDNQGYMWVITDGAWGCHLSSIYRVKELSTGKFDIVLFRALGASLRDVLALPNGDLFLDFGSNRMGGGQCGLYSLTQRVGYTMPIGTGFNHPPIGMTQDGRIYKVCEKNALKF